jgi:hypothetical protein
MSLFPSPEMAAGTHLLASLYSYVSSLVSLFFFFFRGIQGLHLEPLYHLFFLEIGSQELFAWAGLGP